MALPRISMFLNILSDCVTGEWSAIPAGTEGTGATDRDPGFVDLKNGHFRLAPGTKVFMKRLDLQPIPFEKIGRFEDNHRPALRADSKK
jgi:hypothetical protein